MRENQIKEGKRWLEQVTEDLKWAKDLAKRGGYHIACFLSQQVGEKAIKGFLYAYGEEIVIGHSIDKLCAHASLYDKEFEEKMQEDGLYSMVIMFQQDIQTAYRIAFQQKFIMRKLLRKQLSLQRKS